MKSKQIHKVLPVVLGFVALAGASVTASAAITPVNPLGLGTGAERCLEGASCLPGGTYGGTTSLISIFAADLGVGHTLVRMNDSFDTIWHNMSLNSGQVEAIARYAGDVSTLGFDKGAGYQPLLGSIPSTKEILVSAANLAAFKAADPLHKNDYKALSGAPVTIFAPSSQPFAFVLNDVSKGIKWTSNNTGAGAGSTGYANSVGMPNTGGQDHMVTYQVFNEGVAQNDYFIAFEDRNLKTGFGGDHDYNDFVAEVKYVNAIPEPETYAMMLAGLGLMGFVARRRSRNQAA